MTKTPASIYDIECHDLQGRPLPLGQYRWHPLIIVNTASLCGFAPQFKDIEDVWKRERDRGLIVIGVPSGDFGGQELKTNGDIAAMCSTRFNISFPLLAKTHVKGPNAHALFRWLAQEGGFFARPRWNFYKYLIGSDGKLKNWYSCLTSPISPRFNQALAQMTTRA